MVKKYLVAIAVRGKIDVADVEGGHHIVVFVDQVVAVKHVYAGPRGVVCNDLMELVSIKACRRYV